VLNILEQVADGLDYAHMKGYVHGTLKPSHIVIDDDGAFLVAGFGLVHMLQLSGIERSNHPYAHLLSIADTFLIAPEYVAPEVVEGKVVDARSDIYALGAILYELLCGKPPFTGEQSMDVALQHVKQDAPSLRSLNPAIPAGISSVINQALEHDPARRFQQVSELVEAFAQVSCGVTGKLYSVAKIQTAMYNKQALAADANPHPVGQHTSGSWQLVPPIITGKLSAVQLPASSTQLHARSVVQPAFFPETSGNVPAVKPVIAPPAPVNPAPPSAVAKAQEQPGLEQPGQPGNRESMRAFDWWSMVGESPIFPAGAATIEEASVPLTTQRAQSQSPLRLSSNQAEDWDSQLVRPKPLSAPRPGTRRRAGTVGRRRVVAALAAGVVLVVGGVGVFEYERMKHGGNQAAMGQPKPTTGKQSGTGNKPLPQAPMHKGTALGNVQMPVNTSLSFINPIDHKASLLIHLPSGKFVAYEKACTHEGVLVHYDPQTQMLVCPAHGAIFNPAQNGAVVQGPAPTPIAKVAIRVNSDGSVTAA
jgi:serine/threonine protein kinase/Rieske Fe-S protein